MAYDEGLAERVREVFSKHSDADEKKMFGGLCFTLAGNMCCGIVRDNLMARVGPEKYTQCLNESHVSEMDFTGRPMKGMVYVQPEGLEDDTELVRWVEICESFVRSLPPK